jgi:large subunit ribosomal protein L22
MIQETKKNQDVGKNITKPQAKAKITTIKVQDKFISIAPDKIRLVLQLCRNKSLEDAMDIVGNVNKNASRVIIHVLKNAQNQLKEKDFTNPVIKEVIVNEGPKLKRRRIIHRGRATPILKRGSHISIVISDNAKTPALRPVERSKRGS